MRQPGQDRPQSTDVEHWGYADDAGFWYQVGLEVPELMLAFAHRSPAGDA